MKQPGIPSWGRFCPLVIIAVLVVFTACKPKAGSDVPASGAGSPASSATSMAARLDDIRKAGYPTTLDELDNWYPAVPSDANAAPAFNNAFAALVKPPAGALQTVPRTQKLPADVKQSITTALAQNKTARELLHQAAQLKQSRYPVDLHAGLTTTLPHLQSIKIAAQVLGLEAAAVTDNNRADVAATSLHTELALARSLDAEPIIISYLVRNAVLTTTATHLERIVNQGKLTDAQLAALQNALRAAAGTEGLTRAFAAERCMALQMFDLPLEQIMNMVGQAAGAPAPTDPGADMNKHWAKNKERERTFYLDAMELLITGSTEPFPQGLEAAKKLKERLDQLATEPPDRLLFLCRGLLTAYEDTPRKIAGTTARMRCAETALGVERYRLAHAGELPASLAALVPAQLPAVPADPFDGQPLRYKRLAKGYVVYSLGPDLQDGGGLERLPKASEERPHDITFIVEH